MKIITTDVEHWAHGPMTELGTRTREGK